MAKTVHHDEAGKSFFGEEDHLEVSQKRSFVSLIFELLSEKAPNEAELQIFELILNLSIDHGPNTPSAVKVIEEAKKGETISEAVSEGIEEINDTHGGAQEKLMEILYQLNPNVILGSETTPESKVKDSGPDSVPPSPKELRLRRLNETSPGKQARMTVKDLVSEKMEKGERIPGFGHRLYKDVDPRAQLILSQLKDNGMGEEWIKIAQDIEEELQTQKGTKLPLNIDGAIAIALCSFGWDPKLGKAVFIIARAPGLCGQYLNNSPS